MPGRWPVRGTSSPSISKSGFTSAGSEGRSAPDRWDSLPSRVEIDDRPRAGSARRRRRPRHLLRRRLGRRAASAARRAVREAGHEIGSHGYVAPARVTSWAAKRFLRDLRASVARARRRGRRPRFAAFARRSGRSTSVRSGRSTCSSKKGFGSTPAWRRSGWSATESYPRYPHHTTDAVADRFWKCRRSSPIDSGRSCRWDGDGDCG